MMTKLKRNITIGLSIIILLSIYYLSSIVGFNTTDSVGFRFYTHSAYNLEDIKAGNYFILELPETQLYPQRQKIVKKVACTEGQLLHTVKADNATNFFCDGILISQLTFSVDSSGTQLDIFHYYDIIPIGYVFLLGDNEKSYDGRFWGLRPTADLLRLVKPIRFIKNAHAQTTYNITVDRGFYRYEVAKQEDNATKIDNKTTFAMPILPPYEILSVMPPEEFSELYKKVEAYAMSYRTLENFDKYASLRAVMFNRSMEFMNVGTLWGQLNPEDSSETWFPTSGFGQAAYKAQVAEIRLKYIRENSNDYGLLYFYRDDCPYCQKQAPLIKYFEDTTGWGVKWVNTELLPEAALRFNIKTVPAIVLVERSSERSLPVSSGIMTYEEIEERLYRTIKYLKGESDEKDFSNPIRPDNFVNK